jgi:hypothetical protein
MSHEGYWRVQDLLRHGAELACELDDHDLGRGLIDLARTARREIEALKVAGVNPGLPLSSFEGVLLYRLVPEISRRLIAPSGASLLLLPGEGPGADVTSITPSRLRILTGQCVAKSCFHILSERVRDRFDPDYQNPDTFFATEAIQQEARYGNLVEIGLSRAAPPEPYPRDDDILASQIARFQQETGAGLALPMWSSNLPRKSPNIAPFEDLRQDDTPDDTPEITQ